MAHTDDTAKAVGEHDREDLSVIDTLQSLLIAFILAFTFRGFVVEAFVIPTGSMAPTLLGAHAAVRAPDSGYNYTVGPSDNDGRAGRGQAGPVLGGQSPYVLSDPMLMSNRADEIVISNRRTRMGDRILVLKYLYSFFDPTRFDVVVFKNPTDPTENYIKRLVGLPSEAIWLADGDVFSVTDAIEKLRSAGLAADATREQAAEFLHDLMREDGARASEWFAVRRKPEHVQRHVWQPVYHSGFIPIEADRLRGGWTPPWSGEGWDVANRRSYRADSPSPAPLAFALNRAVTDRVAYNEPVEDERESQLPLNVSDIRLAAMIAPDSDGLESTIHLECRGHEFEAALTPTKAQLRMRPQGGASQWTVLADEPIDGFAPAGRATSVEFWHVDQALWLWIDGQRIAHATYDWHPSERLLFATGLSGAQAAQDGSENQYVSAEHQPRPLRLEWRFANSPVTLHRVELDRDLYYRPSARGQGNPAPALATHPTTLLLLDDDQYFCCGDNSPASLDGRLWGDPAPWIAQEIDDAPGVVNRELLLGKAFFVYFPSPEGVREGAIRFVPNFGAMRFIH
ncbi:MAG: signal peptidase I [Phycisphaerales bacterium]|nr:signal peptidase I [Phycisphaerales bacterium]